MLIMKDLIIFLYCIVNKYKELYHIAILRKFEQILSHQSWLIVRYVKISWRVIWPAQKSGSEMRPQSVGFNPLATY